MCRRTKAVDPLVGAASQLRLAHNPHRMRTLTLSAAFLVVVLVCRADAAQITLLSSNGVREAVSELLPQFEKATGHRVQVVWDGTLNIKKRIGSGEIADLVIMPAEDVDSLLASGGLMPGSRVDLAKSIIGVAVRSGVTKPDISTSQKLKAVLLAAKSIVISSGPSGVHLLDLLEKQGILGTVKPRLKQLPSGQSVGEALARGEGELGFQQVSELLHVSGITYVGPLPAESQKVTTFAGGVPKTAKDAAVAREFLTFLRNPRNVAVLKKAGLETP
jgi:molybdate transport system substrate-binding protein